MKTKNAAVYEPQLPASLEDGGDLQEAVRQAAAGAEDIFGKTFRGCLFSDAEMVRMDFRECIFDSCRFSGTLFQRVNFVDVLFRGCDLSNANWQICSALRCRLENCKGVGGDFSGCKLQHFAVRDSNLTYSNFSAAGGKWIRFTDCPMDSSVFLECRLEKLDFENCSLVGANFTNTPLKGVDFSSDQIEGLLLSGTELAGARVNMYQAAQLAKLLGLKIKEDGD